MGKKKTAWDIQARLWDTPGLTPTARLVGLCLLWHRNADTGKCCPSQSRVAKMCGVSVRSVSRAVSMLVDAGVLTAHRTGRVAQYDFLPGINLMVLYATSGVEDARARDVDSPFYDSKLAGQLMDQAKSESQRKRKRPTRRDCHED